MVTWWGLGSSQQKKARRKTPAIRLLITLGVMDDFLSVDIWEMRCYKDTVQYKYSSKPLPSQAASPLAVATHW